MSSLRPAVLASLALVTLATAYCGGKISGVQTTGPDASIPPGNGCPSSEEIYSLGTPCAWSGVCSLQVDVCENGQGVPLATVCSAGTLEVAAGQAYSCSVRVRVQRRDRVPARARRVRHRGLHVRGRRVGVPRVQSGDRRRE
jgi:hypothetical protein